MAKIFVDADGCPVIDIVIKVAKSFSLKAYLICDTSHILEKDGAITVTIPKGADAVDFELVNRMEAGDIVVTQDYGLAAMVLSRKGYAIDQNGRVFTDENISCLLESRYYVKKERKAGKRVKGPKKRRLEQDLQFEKSFYRLCCSIISGDIG